MDQDTLDRIIKMIGMLGSDADGEVLAAAHLIKQHLSNHNLTFGDLKNVLSGSLTITKTVYVEKEPDRNRLYDLAVSLINRTYRMQPHEAKFIHEVCTSLNIPSRLAAQRIARMMKDAVGVYVPAPAMEIFIKENFDVLSRYAHIIHGRTGFR
jgi:hypothetical protein